MKKYLFATTLLIIACIFALPFIACSSNQEKPQPAPLVPGKTGSNIQDQTGSTQPAQGTTGSNIQSPQPTYTTGAGTGFVEVHMTDAPPGRKEITSVIIAVSSIEIHTTGTGQQNQANKPAGDYTAITDNATESKGNDRGPQNQQQGNETWVTINITGNNTFDLLKIKGLDELFAAGKVPAGKYTQVRLVIDQASVGFSDNTTATATVPSNELKFVNSFDVIEGKTTVLTFDFDAEKSVNVTGQDKVMIKPVVRLDVKLK